MSLEELPLTGEEILNRLWEMSIEVNLTTRRFEKGRLGLLFSVFAAEMENLIGIIMEYISQSGIDTITDPALLNSFLKQYIIRGEQTRAKVVLEFTREPGFNENIIIPQEFVVRQGTGEGAIFQTAEDLFMWKGVPKAIVVAYCMEVGSAFNVGANTLTYFEDEGYKAKLSVTNPESAWGGRDDEDLEDARQRALNFRYKREGTIAHILDQIEEFSNLTYHDYNLIEYIEGYGSVGIVLLVDNPYEYEDLCEDLRQNKIAGINYQFIRGKNIYADLNVVITIGGDRDLTPTEDQEIFNTVDEVIKDFFGIGVVIGRNVSLSSLQNALNTALASTYREVLTVEVVVAEDSLVPVNNKILVENNEIIRPNRVVTNINWVSG